MSFWVAGSMAAVSMYSASQSANRQNKAAESSAREATRRYTMNNSIANQQMEEQDQIASDKLTEVSRKFLQARGTAKAIQAESGVAGNVQKRLKRSVDNKEYEVKRQVIDKVQGNKENIARGMLADKVDLEAMIANAKASRINVGMTTAIAGIQGGLQGYSMGKSLQSGGSQTKGGLGSPAPYELQDGFIGPQRI